ncbi:MAG: extracellular solute-binding protein [Microcoleaceae cyanobacterium]
MMKNTCTLVTVLSTLLLTGCLGSEYSGYEPKLEGNSQPEFEVKFLVGSALEQFCQQAAQQFNQQQPKLDSGEHFSLRCEAKGSGDVVSEIVSYTRQLQSGTLSSDAPELPSLISVDGEIYLTQLRSQVEQFFPGQNYIPEVTDAPLLANSPMVFMTSTELVESVTQANLYAALVTATTHQDLDNNSPQIPINFVHTAPTRSNSGLQTLVAQFTAVSGKKPEQLTVADIQQYQTQVQAIQSKITRYGISTHSLAKDMVKNGIYWASIGSVYESSVIQANTGLPPNASRYQAIYPTETFTSNMRAIVPNTPWMNDNETAAAQQVIEYLRSPEAQKIATNLGLRPGVPGVDLGPKFSPEFGVNSAAKYNALRSPKPDVINAMLTSWQNVAKKPSQVVLVVDSSGSMSGDKLPAVQNTLRVYIESLGQKDRITLIDFDSEVRPPVIVDNTPEGRNQGFEFINSVDAEGGTRLYDATLSAQQWLQQNLNSDAINAVIILTDGEDSDSYLSLQQLQKALERTSFNTETEQQQGIAFFTIGYGQEGEFNPEVLKQIAEISGGYYRKGDPQTITELMSDLQVEF